MALGDRIRVRRDKRGTHKKSWNGAGTCMVEKRTVKSIWVVQYVKLRRRASTVGLPLVIRSTSTFSVFNSVVHCSQRGLNLHVRFALPHPAASNRATLPLLVYTRRVLFSTTPRSLSIDAHSTGGPMERACVDVAQLKVSIQAPHSLPRGGTALDRLERQQPLEWCLFSRAEPP